MWDLWDLGLANLGVLGVWGVGFRWACGVLGYSDWRFHLEPYTLNRVELVITTFGVPVTLL